MIALDASTKDENRISQLSLLQKLSTDVRWVAHEAFR